MGSVATLPALIDLATKVDGGASKQDEDYANGD
jgi:hypothetical protein